MNTFEEFAKISQNIPFLSCISRPELEEIQQAIVVKTFDKDQTILWEEEPSDFFYIIYSGKVKVTQINESGKELLLSIQKRGNYFGEMSMIDGKSAATTIIAMENSKIGFFSRKDFVRYIMKNEQCLQQLLNLLCSRLRIVGTTLIMHSYSDAFSRIRAALNVFYIKFGLMDERGKIINLKLTHKDLANYAAMSRETASRIISSLIKSEEIDIVDKKYIRLKPCFFENVPA
jgi:CRP/FNR family transcriptional regulator, cyclic AMP receptor protein